MMTMTLPSSSSARLPLMLCIIMGIIQGILFTLINERLQHPSFEVALVAFYGTTFLLIYPLNPSQWARLVLTNLLVSTLAALPFFLLTNPHRFHAIYFIAAFALYGYHRVLHQHNYRQLPYPDLFLAVWDGMVAVGIASLFTAVVSLIFFGTGELFTVLDIHWVAHLTQNDAFYYFQWPIAFAIGLHLDSLSHKIASALRLMLLTLCQFVFPLLSLIGLLFMLAWFGKVLTGHVLHPNGDWPLLLSFMGVVFINGLYRDGQFGEPYPKLLMYLVNLFILVMPVITLLSLYSVYDHADQVPHATQTLAFFNIHINEANFIALVNTCLLLLYTVGYSSTLLRRQGAWLQAIGSMNMLLGIILIVASFSVLGVSTLWLNH